MTSSVLVVGATGDLGGRVVRELLARGKRVRAFVRPGSDAAKLETQGVEIVRGDMLDPASLDPAMLGMDAVVTSAIGYSHRKKGDSLKTDFEGNRNLVDAAKRAGARAAIARRTEELFRASGRGVGRGGRRRRRRTISRRNACPSSH